MQSGSSQPLRSSPRVGSARAASSVSRRVRASLHEASDASPVGAEEPDLSSSPPPPPAAAAACSPLAARVAPIYERRHLRQPARQAARTSGAPQGGMREAGLAALGGAKMGGEAATQAPPPSAVARRGSLACTQQAPSIKAAPKSGGAAPPRLSIPRLPRPQDSGCVAASRLLPPSLPPLLGAPRAVAPFPPPPAPCLASLPPDQTLLSASRLPSLSPPPHCRPQQQCCPPQAARRAGRWILAPPSTADVIGSATHRVEPPSCS